MRVNWGLGIEETVFRHEIGQIQICLIKSSDRSDVLPISLINKRAYMSIFNRVRNDVFSEIDQIVFQTFDEHLPVEDVNSHRSLVQLLFFVRPDRAQQFPADSHLVKYNLLSRFLDKAPNPAIDSALHDAKLGNLLSMDRFGGQGDVSAGTNVLM